MIEFRRKQSTSILGLNTASLPDLIFTVLFFFMIVTHMRQTNVTVRYDQPFGNRLTQINSSMDIIDVFVGQPINDNGEAEGGRVIQIGNAVVTPDELSTAITRHLNDIPATDRKNVIISLKADRSTPMQIINEIKQALRRAGILRISYSATENPAKQPLRGRNRQGK